MRGHGSSPLGWAVTVLLAVAYAHVLLELAAAGLAITVAVRLMLAAPTCDLLPAHERRSGLCLVAAVRCGGDRPPAGDDSPRPKSRELAAPHITAGPAGGRTAPAVPSPCSPKTSRRRGMIEISISRELAAEHPGFLVGCAERGHLVQVFSTSHERPESDGADMRDPDHMPDAAYVGHNHPGT
jgi:hypothetical protein